ncbi:MAG: tetratricopeptide repeat protein [Pseudomonadota bacterium]
MKLLLLISVVLFVSAVGCTDDPKPEATPLPPNEAIRSGPPAGTPVASRERDEPEEPSPGASEEEGQSPAPTRPSSVSAPTEDWNQKEWFEKEDVGTIEIIQEEDPVKQRYKEALELLEIDKIEQAIALLEENAVAAPDDPINHWNLASVQLALDHAEAALPPLRKAVELSPDNTEYALTLAGVELLVGNNAAAEALLETLVKAHPELPDVHYQLGLLHIAADRADTAFADLLETTRLDPKHAAAWTRLAILHVEAQRWADALVAVQAVQAAGDPEAAEAVGFLHGQVLGKLGRCEDAGKVLAKAREAGQAELADLAEGECWLGTSEPDKALPLLRAASERNPSCQPCQMFLGDALFLKGDWTTAADAYSGAAAAEPGDWRSRRQAGKCLLNLQRPGDAVPLLEGAVKIAAEDVEAWELLGRAYIATGNKAETWTVMERLETLGAAERAKIIRQLLTQ